MAERIDPIAVAVEGPADEAVIRRLCRDSRLEVEAVFGKQGKHWLLKRLHNYNSAARHRPWVVLLDLDSDADCAPTARLEWLPSPASGMRFCIAVRAVEAWLLADRETLAEWLSVSEARIPRDPESEPDPKRTLVSLARRSRRREIRENLAPPPGSNWSIGPGYIPLLREYIGLYWRPKVAAERARSLARCLLLLERIGA